jgi:hypothetical protein
VGNILTILDDVRDTRHREDQIRDMIRKGEYRELPFGDCIFDFGTHCEVRGGDYVRRMKEWGKS